MLLVVLGIVLGQALLYGPALIGRTLLLPLDVLALPSFYLPPTPAVRALTVDEPLRSDPVLYYEPVRRFAVREVRAGRLPAWDPHTYGGAAFVRFGTYGPFAWLSYLWPSPKVLAWTQLLVALIAGLGAYTFFRRVLGLGFAAAAVGAWCYPLTGYFVLWQGYPVTHVAAWLPWTLLATDAAVVRPRGWGPPALALVTALAVHSGHVDVAGHVLLAAGLWAVGRLIELALPGAAGTGSLAAERVDDAAAGRDGGSGRWLRRVAGGASGAVAGWLLGLLLAAPILLPLAAALGESERLGARGAGSEERPPAGLAAAPQVVLPDVYGASRAGSLRITAGNRLESAATAYAGLVATLLLAPIAFTSRSRRAHNVRLLLLAVVAVGWTFDLVGIVSLLRLPGLDLLSHNRFVFVTGFALLALAATGLDRLLRVRRRLPRSLLVGCALLLVVVAGWCAFRSRVPPEPVRSQLRQHVAAGGRVRDVADLDAVAEVERGFRRASATGAAWAALALGAAALLLTVPGRRRAVAYGLAAVAVIEPLAWASGLSPQNDPALDYPPLPVLAAIEGENGRVLGVRCLPPRLLPANGRSDVRGHDGIEPGRFVELLRLAADPSAPQPVYASTLWLVPRPGFLRADGVHLHPVLDLLGVRWLVFRGSPPPAVEPAWRGLDYWLLENPRALPRAFVPARVETVADRDARLRRLADDAFEPRRLALVEADLGLPPPAVADAVSGSARIVDEVPTRVEIEADLDRPGLVVLADRWSGGWHASVDGAPAPVVRVDHALRGVVVPAGTHRIVMRYEPVGLRLGLLLAGAATLALAIAGLRRVTARRGGER